jgi:hypothetical protein
LFLRHCHPAERAALLIDHYKAGVVFQRDEMRLPPRGNVRLSAQRGNGRVSHRERAARARLDSAHRQHHRCAGGVTAGSGLAPRKTVDPGRYRDPHQLVPGGMELDLVDPITETIVRLENRWVLVRLGPEPEAPSGPRLSSQTLERR